MTIYVNAPRKLFLIQITDNMSSLWIFHILFLIGRAMMAVSVQPHSQMKGIFNHRRIVRVMYKTMQSTYT